MAPNNKKRASSSSSPSKSKRVATATGKQPAAMSPRWKRDMEAEEAVEEDMAVVAVAEAAAEEAPTEMESFTMEYMSQI
jgi:hypothetical protein